MEWLTRIINATWFRAALAGTMVVSFGLVLGWSYGKGYDAAEDVYLKAMNKALKEQHAAMIVQSQVERELAIDAMEKKYAIRQKISDVPEPIDSCSLSPECLHWFDNILRAAITSGEGAD